MGLASDRGSNNTHTHTLSQVDTAQANDAKRMAAIEANVTALQKQTADQETRIKALEAAQPAPTPLPPDPTPTPPAGTRVTSIAALKAALKDNTITSIIVANGTYAIDAATNQNATSLWIGSEYAGRTNPVTITAETKWGVTFDRAGGQMGGIAFEQGAHDQTWDGFVFANGKTTDTAVVVFGGYATPAAHHITMRNIKILASCKGSGSVLQGYARDHGVYFSNTSDGVHDILFEDWNVDCSGGLASAFQWDNHGSGPINKVTIRRAVVNMGKIGTNQQGILMWAGMVNTLIEDTTITDASSNGVTYQYPSTGNVLRRVNSTGSPNGLGLVAPNGQAGLTLDTCSLK